MGKDSSSTGAVRVERCLVTGASGLIGRALLSVLDEEGILVRATDRSRPRFSLPASVEFHDADLLDPAAPLGSLLEGCDAVFHLAARMPQARLDEAGFHRENVEVTERLASASAQAGVRRFLFASTIEVYGVQEIEEPLSEDDTKQFTGTYSRNKWETEERLLKLAGPDMESVALRMPMIFGPGFYHEKAMIALFFAVKLGLPVPVPVREAPVSFVSSRDVGRAFVMAARAPGCGGEAFNVCASDHPLMYEFFVDVARRTSSRSRPFVVRRELVERGVRAAQRRARGPDGRVPLLGTPAELVPYILTGGAYSIDKARRLLGFEPLDSCVDAWISAYDWFWSRPWRERVGVAVFQRV